MSKNEYTVGQNAHKKHNGLQGPPGGMMGVEKAKSFKETWGKLIRYSRNHLFLIIIALFCATISAVLTLVGPEKLSEMTDLITEGLIIGIDLTAISKIGILLAAMYGLSALFSLSQGLIMATVTQKICKSLRTDISQKINTLPMWYYNKTTTGDVLSRVTNDVDTIGQSLNQSIGTLVTSVTLLGGALIMMFITNVVLAVTAVVASLIGFIAMMVIIGKSQKHFSLQQKYLGKINGHVEEVYAGHTVVKAYNGEANAKEIFDRTNEELRDSGFKAQFLSGFMMPLMTFIGNFGYVAVCVVGAVLAMNGTISFGVIVAFIVYVRLFTQPLSQIAQAAQSMQSAAAASERVFEFMEAEDMEEESNKSSQHKTSKGEVEFRNVHFGYEDSDNIVINNFSAFARPGQKIAIVGPTGAGKTTMVNLLMRFHEIQSGSILIDGIPISDMTREEVHSQFCMVLQDTWLFEGTIRENVVYCQEGVTDKEVERACEAVGLHHFIHTLPHGYDTVLNDKVNLSAGQKQQITIARAMAKNASMLILDEATSSVDTRTELNIQKSNG